MRNSTLALLSAASIGLASFAILPVNVVAQSTQEEAPATEDVLHMRDGRVLRGKIVNETRLLVVFEYVDPAVNSKAKLNLPKDTILQIDRGVAVGGETTTKTDTAPTTPTPATRPSSTSKTTNTSRTYGVARATSGAEETPSFYIVPMKGQMGTDVNPEIYHKIMEDIRARKPDVVIIRMDCQDTEDVLYSEKSEALEGGLIEFDEYRTLIRQFRTDLRDFRQVMLVDDSLGISSMVAMAWPEIYMKPNARFGGLGVTRSMGFFGIPDPDVREKMVAALMGFVKSFLETGGYSLVLADAMVKPPVTLSASWHGREVNWSLGTEGEYVVDGSDGKTAEFRAKTAEDFAISKGTVENFDDLALLLGYREYSVMDGMAEKLITDYIASWRREYENAKKLLADIEQFLGWAGSDPVRYLGQAQAAWKKILASMERYKAVEIRLSREYGLTKSEVTIKIAELGEEIRAARGGRAGAGTGGGPGGTGGGAGRAN